MLGMWDAAESFDLDAVSDRWTEATVKRAMEGLGKRKRKAERGAANSDGNGVATD